MIDYWILQIKQGGQGCRAPMHWQQEDKDVEQQGCRRPMHWQSEVTAIQW